MKNKFLDAIGLSSLIAKIKGFVKVNEPLEGGEDSLTSLTVNGIKLKAGGSDQHLYWHTIQMRINTAIQNYVSGTIYLTVLSDSATALTWSTFYNLVVNNLYAKFLVVTGETSKKLSDSYERVIPLYVQSISGAGNDLRLSWMPIGSGQSDTTPIPSNSVDQFYDTVNQIF